ncbi:MAG: hypothetical protein WC352_07005 [Candidatus Omnitrophota bacterium]
MKQIKWVEIALVLAVGFFAGTTFGEWKMHEGFHHRCEKKDMKSFMLKRLDRKLHLSAGQKTKIGEILDRRHPAMTALHEEFRPRFQELREATRTEIRTVLEPKQQTKFDELSAEWEKRWAGRFPGVPR